MMNDPKIWPDASSFVPERWLGPYKGVEVDRKAFLPFSAGTRNCKFEVLESKISSSLPHLIVSRCVRQSKLPKLA